MVLNALVLSHHFCELRSSASFFFCFFFLFICTLHIREGSLSAVLSSSKPSTTVPATAATAGRWEIKREGEVMGGKKERRKM